VLLSYGSKAAPDNRDLMATSIEQSPEVIGGAVNLLSCRFLVAFSIGALVDRVERN
jgi:hypothetical protein